MNSGRATEGKKFSVENILSGSVNINLFQPPVLDVKKIVDKLKVIYKLPVMIVFF